MVCSRCNRLIYFMFLHLQSTYLIKALYALSILIFTTTLHIRFHYHPTFQVRKPRLTEVKCQVTANEEWTRVTTPVVGLQILSITELEPLILPKGLGQASWGMGLGGHAGSA